MDIREGLGFAICGQLIFGNHAVGKAGRVAERLGTLKALIIE